MMPGKPSFMRGEKSSVSVRVRNKKEAGVANGSHNCKKRNRHSGDFSFFNHKNAIHESKDPMGEDADEKSSDGGGDWAYITFPNGIPTVQDIKTNGPTNPENGASNGPNSAQPVKVVTRDVPGINFPLGGPASLYGVPENGLSFKERPVSGYTRERGTPQIFGDGSIVVLRNKAQGRAGLNNNIRHSRIVEEQLTGVHLRNPSPSHYVTKVNVFNPSHTSQALRPNHLLRRKSEQPQSMGPHAHPVSGVGKRCSGEFEFVKNNRRSGDFSSLFSPNPMPSRLVDGSMSQPGTPSGGPATLTSLHQQFSSMIYTPPAMQEPGPVTVKVRGSETPGGGSTPSTPSRRRGSEGQKQPSLNGSPSVVLRRQTGLGRRAVTQIQIHQKKNSYVSAVCKSQENLVKAGQDTQDLLSDQDNEDNDKETSNDNAVSEEDKNYSQVLRSKSTVKKGLLWQQRDKLFSQWKERYFILTTDYLQCFKKGSSKVTEMGEFIFKIKLSEVDDVDLQDKRGYLVVSITPSGREGKIYLRKTEGIRDWFDSLKECVKDSKKRKNDRNSGGFWKAKQLTDSSSIENWIKAKKKIGLQYSYLDQEEVGTSRSNDEDNKNKGSVPHLAVNSRNARSEITLDELSDLYRHEELEEEAKKRLMASASPQQDGVSKASPQVQIKQSRSSSKLGKKINRLSLMSDLELPDLSNPNNQHHLSIDLEKGIFRNKAKANADNESNDSGNNSMNTNGSVGSSNSSHSTTRYKEERLETHLESDGDETELSHADQPKSNEKSSSPRNSSSSSKNSSVNPSPKSNASSSNYSLSSSSPSAKKPSPVKSALKHAGRPINGTPYHYSGNVTRYKPGLSSNDRSNSPMQNGKQRTRGPVPQGLQVTHV